MVNSEEHNGMPYAVLLSFYYVSSGDHHVAIISPGLVSLVELGGGASDSCRYRSCIWLSIFEVCDFSQPDNVEIHPYF